MAVWKHVYIFRAFAKAKMWLQFSVELRSNILSPAVPENTRTRYFLVRSVPRSHSVPVHTVPWINPVIPLWPHLHAVFLIFV